MTTLSLAPVGGGEDTLLDAEDVAIEQAWLRTGCNTTETARIIHLERQSLHARLQKIFELIGGDPRGTLRLAGLTLAVRVARNRTG